MNPSDFICGSTGPRRVHYEQQSPVAPATERTPLLVTSQPKKKTKRTAKFDTGPPEEFFYPDLSAEPFAYRRRAPRLIKPTSGWATDESDSELEYLRDPSKRPEDSELQSFLVVAMVMLVLAILAAIKGYHIYHGTEEREENRPKGGYY